MIIFGPKLPPALPPWPICPRCGLPRPGIDCRHCGLPLAACDPEPDYPRDLAKREQGENN